MKAKIKGHGLDGIDITETYDVTSCFVLIEQLCMMAEFVNDNSDAHPSAFYETTKSMAMNIKKIKEAVLGEEEPTGSALLFRHMRQEECRGRAKKQRMRSGR